MLYLAAGSFKRGNNQSVRADEKPEHLVRVRAFYLDDALVTVGDFRRYAESNSIVTKAEKLGYSMVAYEGMRDWEWKVVPGANWKNPFGPDFPFEMHEDFPVVNLSWDDAELYCRSIGKRLPSEAEWEYAARAGSSGRFPAVNSGWNYWQGDTHTADAGRDGFKYFSEVRAFTPNAWGMYDPIGNVWQLTGDYYNAFEYPDCLKVSKEPGVCDNPKGPDHGFERVARGGSWWCSESTCNGYGLNYRGKSSPGSVFNNTGFRCARDANKPELDLR